MDRKELMVKRRTIFKIMGKYVIWFNTKYACGAVICDENGKIIETCPIYRKRMIGRHFRDVEKEFRSKTLLIEWKLAHKEG